MGLSKAFEEIFAGIPFMPSENKTLTYVRRYNTTIRQDIDFPFGPVPGTVLDPEGLLVSYSDYQKLHQQNEALKSIIKKMGELL